MDGGVFHGLFVGLDFSGPSGLHPLKYAAKDARVLQALFQDNCAGESNLVLNQDATKDRILTEIRHIADVSTHEDSVVVAFSGHGTTSGELVAFSPTSGDKHRSVIPLDTFVAEVEKISARLLVVVLDCCFVGGHLAKALKSSPHDHAGRSDTVPIGQVLRRISGEGRFVLAASGEGERAFEGLGTSHGLLTHYLIRGLLGGGAPSGQQKRSLLNLADYVMRKVASHPDLPEGKEQNPFLGARTTDARISTFTKGPKYAEVVSGTELAPVTRAMSSLKEHGFPQEVLAMWQAKIGKLNELQRDVINVGELFSGNNLVVSAPTSSGKTMVGEIAAIRAITQGGKAAFLLPTRALVNEQYDRFVREYGPVGIKTVRATGELRDQVPELLAGEFGLAVCTYEKFIALLNVRPDLLTWVRVLVVDEMQTLAFPDRGPRLEMLLTRVRPRLGRGTAPQVIGLSATIDGCEQVAEWLGAGLVNSDRRRTPLLEGVVRPGGEYRFIGEDGEERMEILPYLQDTDDSDLAVRLIGGLIADEAAVGGKKKQVIVFRSTRSLVWNFAKKLADRLGLPPAEAVLESLSRGDEGWLDERLRECLEGGIAFHLSDLGDDRRRLIEESFRAGNEVRVLVSTTTLAQGLNLPADAVVICELEHPKGNGRGSRNYLVSEYKNMAGRAGRTGLTEEGRSFIVASSEIDADQKLRRYVRARPEPLRSALLAGEGDLRGTVLAALAALGTDASGSPRLDVRDFLAWTFASYQAEESGELSPFPPEKVEPALEELCGMRLLRDTGAGFVLTELGSIAARGGLHVDSVATLAEVLPAVPPNEMNRMTLIGAAQLTRELSDPRFANGTRGERNTLNRLEKRMRTQGVAAPVLNRMRNFGGEDSALSQVRRSIACLMWSRGVGISQIEQVITLETHPERRGSDPVRQAARRTSDIMRAVIEIGMLVNPEADFGDLPELLPAQLDLGIVGGLVPIAKWAKVLLPRSAYLDLARGGLVTVDSILDADPATVRSCLEGDDELLRVVLEAAEFAKDEAERRVDLDALIPPAID